MVAKANFRTMKGYRQQVLARTQAELQRFYSAKRMKTLSLDQIKADEIALRTYPGLENCDMKAVGTHIHTITEASVAKAELRKAEQVKLAGEEIVEDHAAGEATRLKLGTKYLLTPHRIVEALLLHNLRDPEKTIPIPVSPQDLAQISLGIRHKLQYIYDLTQLAASPQFGPALNPKEVLKSQFTLTMLNEETQLGILREIGKYKHFGLSPERTLFMVQEKGLGINIADGKVFFDPASDWRLWNHGDMKVQQTLKGKIFWVRTSRKTGELEKHFITPEEFETTLSGMRNTITYPIEDIDYLTGSINLFNLAVSLRLGKQGARFTMEPVAQQEPPQIGGFFTFNPSINKVVCVESDCGGDIIVNDDPATLALIEFLNKNFNNSPEPVEAFRSMHLLLNYLHLAIKGGHLYPQVPQGDQNFNLETAVIQWDPVKTIRNFKTLPHGAPTLLAMQAQDRQPGFLDLPKELGIIK